MAKTLEFSNVSKTYPGGKAPAVRDVSFSVDAGEIVALVGESGSGKTTLLRLASGLEVPDAGSISIEGKIAAGDRCWLPPERRQVGFVFQDGALFPHLTVAGNVAYGLRGMDRERTEAAVDFSLAMVGLSGFHDRFPHALSGGERQRLALARSLAPQPRFILLDEPFSNLDPSLRRSLREEVLTILRKAAATAILVTHDTEDAAAVGDRMIVLRSGAIEQTGTPRELYWEPKNGYCARLFGPSNRVRLNGDPQQWIRPEQMRFSCEKPGGLSVPVRIRKIQDTGRHLEAIVDRHASVADGGGEPWMVMLDQTGPWEVGQEGWIEFLSIGTDGPA